jgi:hypothetical protein
MAALVVLVAFGAFVVFLVVEVNASEVRWSRLARLIVSVEAIAFGRQVLTARERGEHEAWNPR